MQRMKLHRNCLFLIVLAVAAFLSAEGRSPASAVWRSVVPTFDSDSLTNAEIDSIVSSIELDEVVVTAEVPAIVVKGDTTIVNSSQFRVWDGAAVKDLVKRIPGMEYDSRNNRLTYNGREITEINVNGETFFGSDLAIGLERLRAELIGKIKIYDKTDEADRLLNLRRPRKNLVLDLQTKDEFDKMLMTSAHVERGNRDKRDLSLVASCFRSDGDNFWTNFQSGNKYSTSHYEGNRTDALYANVLKKIGTKFDISANLSYDRSRQGTESSSYNEQYLPAANNYMYGSSDHLMRDRKLGGIMGLHWRPDDKTLVYVSVRPGMSKNNSGNASRQATFSSNPGLDIKDPFGGDDYESLGHDMRINDITRKSDSRSRGRNWSASASVTRRLNEKGLGLTVNTSYNRSRNRRREFSVSDTRYYRLENSHGGDSVLYRNFYYASPTLSQDYSAGLSLSQELRTHMSLALSYNFSSGRRRSVRETFDLSPFAGGIPDETIPALPPGYEAGYVDSLSNHTISRTIGHEGSLSYYYFTNSIVLMARMSLRPERQTLDQKTGLLQADTVRNSVNYSPALTFSWNNGGMELGVEYSGNTEQPSLSSLLSLVDNSDPLYVTRGNPDLKASYSQDIGLSFSHSKSGLSASLGYANTYNSETQAVIYDVETGGRLCYPVNINGNWNSRASLRFYKRFFKKFNLSTELMANRGEYAGLVNDGSSPDPKKSVTATDAYSTRLRTSYNPLWGSIELMADWRYNRSLNRLMNTANHTRDYRVNLNAHVDLPCGFFFRNETGFTFRNGTNINSREDSQVLWNMEAGFRFLKHKAAKISVMWYDILSDKKDFNRYSSSSGFTESYQRQIGSYFMVGFEYRFDKHI